MEGCLTKWMSFVLSIFVCAFSMSAFSFEHSSDVPGWVAHPDIPFEHTVPTEQVQDGIYYLLVDKQEYVENNQFHSYRRYVATIINQQGIDEFSQINITHDPSYELLAFHKLNVYREGERQNRIATSKFQLLDIERELESQIYNQQKDLNVLLSDLRVGDTIEYSFSTTGRNPVYANHYQYTTNLNWSVPVERLYVQINWFEQRPLYFQVFDSHSTYDVESIVSNLESATGQIFVVDQSRVAPVIAEDDRPVWHSPWRKLQFSDSNSWQQVAEWASGLYQQKIVASAEVVALAKDFAKLPTAKQRISAALQFVQNEIRYVGIEFGVNSHLPSLPSETLARRYGDCKDKTVLFVTLLQELGINAWPALVHTDKQQTIEQRLPAVSSFNHVIAKVELDGVIYWLDPTRSYQFGSIDEIYQPDYAFALVVANGILELEPMNNQDTFSGIEMIETFTLAESYQEPIKLEVDSIYTGWKAAQQRRKLDADGIAHVSKSYLDYYVGEFGKTTALAELNVIDNKHSNKFRLQEKYQLEQFWQEEGNSMKGYFDTSSVASYLDIPEEPDRKYPLELTYPIKVKHQQVVNFATDNWYFDDEEFTEENQFFDFTFTVEWHEAAKQLKVTYQYQAKTSYVDAQQYDEYLAALKRVEDYQSYSIYKSTHTPITDSELIIGDKPLYWSVIGLSLTGYFVLLLLWIIRYKKQANHEQFYQVSAIKFVLMNTLTLGMFSTYWFYRNFKHIQFTYKQDISPVWRAIFFIFFIHSLWSQVQNHSIRKIATDRLLVYSIAMGLACLLINVSGEFDIVGLFVFTDLAIAIVLLPLLNAVNQLEQQGSVKQGIASNSTFNVFHIGVASAYLLMTVFTVTEFFNLTPQSKVVEGKKLWRHDINMMVNKGIIKAKEPIKLFYSDALVWFKADGNGFTEQRVFSYWVLDGVFYSEVAEYQDIADIKVEWGEDDENSVITITRVDNSEFYLYVSSLDDKDEEFESKLRSIWQNKQQIAKLTDAS